MSPAVITGLAIAGWSLIVAFLVVLFMGCDDPTEDEAVEESWPTPDYFDDVPLECLSPAAQVERLERTWLL